MELFTARIEQQTDGTWAALVSLAGSDTASQLVVATSEDVARRSTARVLRDLTLAYEVGVLTAAVNALPHAASVLRVPGDVPDGTVVVTETPAGIELSGLGATRLRIIPSDAAPEVRSIAMRQLCELRDALVAAFAAGRRSFIGRCAPERP